MFAGFQANLFGPLKVKPCLRVEKILSFSWSFHLVAADTVCLFYQT